MANIYQFKVATINGQLISLDTFRGKVLLIVNTASECTFTPHLKDLELLYSEFAKYDFEILAFPSNDFGNQEPLEGTEIVEFCRTNYGVSFPFFEKVRVRGPYACDLFKFLGSKKENGKFSAVPRWNFQKYLINKKGELEDFYYPFTKPTTSRIRKKIQRLLTLP